MPIELTFALINGPDIVDLTPGNSFIGFLLEAGSEVYLLEWGPADEEDANTSLDDSALEFIPRVIREVRRPRETGDITLIGWCIGTALPGMNVDTAYKLRKPMPNLFSTPLRCFVRSRTGRSTTIRTFPCERSESGWPGSIGRIVFPPVGSPAPAPDRRSGTGSNRASGSAAQTDGVMRGFHCKAATEGPVRCQRRRWGQGEQTR